MVVSYSQAKLFEVLLIEDSEADRRLLHMALEEATIQCRVHDVEDGEAALRHLRGKPNSDDRATADLILLDLHLSGRNGRAVLRQIRKDEHLRCIPVILLAGRGEDEIDGSAAADFCRCVRKPSDRATYNQMVAAIEDACAGLV